jgi:hypothetical protein
MPEWLLPWTPTELTDTRVVTGDPGSTGEAAALPPPTAAGPAKQAAVTTTVQRTGIDRLLAMTALFPSPGQGSISCLVLDCPRWCQLGQRAKPRRDETVTSRLQAGGYARGLIGR